MVYKFSIYNKPQNVVFLDVDGVLNYELFFKARYEELTKYDKIPYYRAVKKYLTKRVKKKEISDLEFYQSQMCPVRMEMLNNFCDETNSAVVLSASMRGGWTSLQLNRIFQHCGATFTLIDKTGHSADRIRGVEILNWLKDNSERYFNEPYYEFDNYIILDDDSDMLLWQEKNFFQVDPYAGLTENILYRAKRLLTGKF